MTDPALVVLAAGMGSRYGGLKQLEAVGPGGATLMDYAVYDAWRAGFKRVVCVIRPDMEDPFREFAATRFGGKIAVSIAHQRLDGVPVWVNVPRARRKPWGTGHAVLAVEGLVSGPFAVANSDDFYGRRAFEAAAAFLKVDAGGEPPACAGVGYRLRETLSGAGGVNRAILKTETAGWLKAIVEVFEIATGPGGAIAGRTGRGPARLNANDMVSMNLWALTPEVFPMLHQGFSEFLASNDLTEDEFLLPDALDAAARSGTIRVKVLDPKSSWWGVTYPDDLDRAGEAIGRLVKDGLYPERLWD